MGEPRTIKTHNGKRRESGHNGNRPRADREAKYEQFRKLRQKGLSDMDIAIETGVCDRTVRDWRRREGIPAIWQLKGETKPGRPAADEVAE